MTSNIMKYPQWIAKKAVKVLKKTFTPSQPSTPPVPFKAPEDLSELAPLVRVMAESGQGTDACLEMGCLPVLVHYYSAIPDIKDLERRDSWNKTSNLAGINFRPEEQVKFLLKIGQQYGGECVWPLTKTLNPTQFYLKNQSFSYGCAAALHTMIRYWKPRRIIEIGSGYSSRVISAAISQNLKDNPNNPVEYKIVDPYPDEASISILPNLSHLEKQRVELLDPSFFEQLGENDILFIDSSHSVKIGSDVNYLILQILPNLAPGVVVHLHDIPMPYEYNKVYATSPTFRMFWTESYLLQAFLSLNREYEILLAMNYLMLEHMDRFCEAFSKFEIKDNWSNSGSIWIRRVTA